MRRILIAERTAGWSFDREHDIAAAPTPLLAANEARIYGESLKGKALGYIIRLDTGKDLVTLHTQIF
jgi:hypothetical protein